MIVKFFNSTQHGSLSTQKMNGCFFQQILRQNVSWFLYYFCINPNLGGGGVIFTCWFSLNNSETVKAAALAFCSIQ